MRGCKVHFGVDLCAAPLQHLWDHRVQGQALAPAAMLLEMAACAAHLLTGVCAWDDSASQILHSLQCRHFAVVLSMLFITKAVVIACLECGNSWQCAYALFAC